MRAIGAVVLAGATIMTMTACTSGADLAAFETTAPIVWELTDSLIGSIAVGDDVVLAYTRVGDAVSMTAWDLEQGIRLWRHPVSLGVQAPGFAISAASMPVDGRDYAAYLERAGGGFDLRVVDAVTGDALAGSTTMHLESAARPRVCDDGQGFCLDARRAGYADVIPLRVNPSMDGAALAVDDEDLTPEGARMLGRRVFASDQRAPEGVEQLGAVDDRGAVIWQRPYEDVFGPHASSDHGWNWSVERDNVIVGFGGGYPPAIVDAVADGHAEIDVSAGRRVVGLDARTGETRWAVQGGIGCPGLEDSRRYGDIVALCRIDRGALIVDRHGDAPLDEDWTGIEATMIGVDVGTGSVVWEAPLPAGVLDPDGRRSIRSGDRLIVLQEGTSAVSLDPRTGDRAPIENAVLACEEPREPLLAPPDENGVAWEMQVGFGVFSCHADRSPAAALSIGAARAVGSDAGDGIFIVATTRGLIAVRAG